MIDNPLLYPPAAQMKRLEYSLPLPPEVQQRRTQIWERFVAGVQ